MSAEIADSDAESEFASPQRPPISPIEEDEIEIRQLDPSAPDPVLDLQFSQFLSPTQRLSSAIQHPNSEAHPHSTGSTERFLQAISQERRGLSTAAAKSQDSDLDLATGPRKKSKRRFSDIEEHTSSLVGGGNHRRNGVKKTKTYQGIRTMETDPVDVLFPEDRSSSIHSQHMASPKMSQEETIITNHQALVDSIDNNSAQAKGQIQIDSKVAQHQNTVSQATRNNMGTVNGYQGITLDFRHDGAGLDVNINPFGSLSQVSFDGDINPAEVKELANLFGGRAGLNGTGKYAEIDLYRQERPNGTENSVVDLEVEQLGGPALASDVVTHSSSQLAGHPEALNGAVNRADLATTIKKKRKRKNRSIDTERRSDSIEVEEHPQFKSSTLENHAAGSRTAQTGDVDSQQPSSQLGQGIQPTKPKLSSSQLSLSPKLSSSKNLSSDLGLNDPNMIGLPAEVYHAKPSRSRSKRVSTEALAESPGKVNVADDDELVIAALGRSGKLNDTDDNKRSKKSQRKTKVKRTKTTGADSSKQTQAWGDEEDDEVIWLDKETAEAKLDLASEEDVIKVEKTESLNGDGHSLENHIKSEDTECEAKNPAAGAQLVIEVPPLPKPKSANNGDVDKQPKKRGRKPKKKSDIIIENQQVEAVDVALSENAIDERSERKVLGEKSTNLSNIEPVLSAIKSIVSDRPNIAEENDENATLSLKKQPPSQEQVISPLRSVNSIDISASSKATSSSLNSASATATASRSESPSSTSKLITSKTRVGLSRSTRIPSLLRNLDRSKEPPKIQERKEKLTKRQLEEQEKRRLDMEDCEGDDGNANGNGLWTERGTDGMLIEWND